MKTSITLILTLLLFWTGYTQTWIRQNPFPKLIELTDVHFDDAHGLAVGQEGVCFTTHNFGTTWAPGTLSPEGYAFDAAFVVPGTKGQVMFAGGITLMRSMDGGATWDLSNNSPGNTYAIQTLSDGTIIALGRDYNVFSKNLGDTWDVINNPVEGSSAGYFTDLQHGWVESGSFNQSQVWVTIDGGQSWNVRDTTRHPVIYGIHMLDTQKGYMSARDYVYKTSDGGEHWVRLHDNAVNSIQDLHVTNENDIWTCLNNGFIFYSRNGGLNWTEINPNIISSNKTNGIYANASGQVWSTGKFVSILYSPDGANNWSDQIPGAKSIMYRPHFLDENHGIVGASEGKILWTENGGASWDIMSLDPDENFFSPTILNEQSAVIGSSSGRIFATTNRGLDWTLLGENLGQIVDMHIFNNNTAIAVSEQGTIWRTSTGGGTWDAVYISPFGLLQGLHFIDDQKGWACGWFGQVLFTADGGLTWDTQVSNSNGQFKDIHFTTENDGWIVSSAFTDSVWHTSNGGQSWEGRKLPYSIFWHGVTFSSRDTGWIVGGSAGSGLVIRTNDGGQNWVFDHQSPEALFGIYAIPGKETVWSTGFGGNIMKYSPCTFSPAISNLTGESNPCQKDTVTYAIQSSDVDLFEWTFPSDWLVYGNSNTSSIQFIVGIQSGTVQVIGKDACGATTASLSLDVFPNPVPEAVISELGGILTCDLDSGFYQWLNNGNIIPGANEQSYTPTSSGQYEVVVTLFSSGCEIRSNLIEVLINSTIQAGDVLITIYPNPSLGLVYVDYQGFGNEYKFCKMTLFDLEGRKIYDHEDFTSPLIVNNLVQGMYVAVIQIDDKTHVQKIMVE
jgi:photosystem II stability/assembly factor-like uncharacterized protein